MDIFDERAPYKTTTAIVSSVDADGAVSFRPDGAPQGDSSPLAPFIGPVLLLDLAPWQAEEIDSKALMASLEPFFARSAEEEFNYGQPLYVPGRVIIKTQQNHEIPVAFPYLSLDAIAYLYANGVQLVGIDTPCIEPVEGESTGVADFMNMNNMPWIVNLDLSQQSGMKLSFLIAAPVKCSNSHITPVRAMLLDPAH
jgi:arylformamidase